MFYELCFSLCILIKKQNFIFGVASHDLPITNTTCNREFIANAASLDSDLIQKVCYVLCLYIAKYHVLMKLLFFYTDCVLYCHGFVINKNNYKILADFLKLSPDYVSGIFVLLYCYNIKTPSYIQHKTF